MRSDLLIRRSRATANPLVLWHPLESDLATLPTEQTMDKVGTVSFGSYQGYTAASFAASGYLVTTSGPMLPWPSALTFCVWAYFGSYGGTRTFISAGNTGAVSMSRNGSNQFNTFGHTFDATIGQSAWHHVAASLDADGLIVTIYRDGVQVDTYTRAQAPNIGSVTAMAIGGNVPGYTYNTRAVGMRDARIYKRVLTLAELATVMNGGHIQ